jgi:uncharacterized cysteine cluster protein YcgN (CxxCxxCC family)
VSEWWNSLPLAELSGEQWEALCDGCARCCLHKLQHVDTGEIAYTGVRCRYLVESTCRCSDYPNRSRLMENCVDLSRESVAELDWLPATCAYRLRSRGEPLPPWHPLVSGDPESVHRAGISIRGRSVSDEYVHPDGFDDCIVSWVE